MYYIDPFAAESALGEDFSNEPTVEVPADQLVALRRCCRRVDQPHVVRRLTDSDITTALGAIHEEP